MNIETAIELPKITETEELHFALKVFRSKRPLKKFVEEFGFEVLENCKHIVDLVIEEKNEELKKEEQVRKNHEEAILKAAEGYVDAMLAAGVTISIDDALATIQGGAISVSHTKPKTKNKISKPRKTYKFIIAGEIVERSFVRASKNIVEEMESQGYTEQWQLLSPDVVDEFINDVKDQPAYKSKIAEIKAFFKPSSKKSKKNEDEVPALLSSKVEYSLLLDVSTAKEKFNIEMTEDFIFEGNSDGLSVEQEKLLIAISDDDTVEGGIEAIESLTS